MNPDQTAPGEHSDLGPYCLQYWLPKNISRRDVTLHARKFIMLWLSADFFSKLAFFFFFKKFFQEHYQSVKQFRNSVQPDLGPYCLQRLSANGKSDR